MDRMPKEKSLWDISTTQDTYDDSETNLEKSLEKNREHSWFNIDWENYPNIAREISELLEFTDANFEKDLVLNKVFLHSSKCK